MSDMQKYDQPGALAIPDDLRGVGQEDVDQSDFQQPRLKIDHNTGQFKLFDNVFDEFDAIVLGMLKQRVLWQPKLEENVTPICRSFDFKEGHPDPEKWSARYAGEEPADASGFGAVTTGQLLPCRDCGLKEFGTHPISEKAPWCAEQHVYPLLVLQDGGYQPAILTLAKTGLAPSRTYMQPFLVKKVPFFTVTTHFSLNTERKGGNTYSVPVLTKGEPSDSTQWREWADQFRAVKEILQTPRDFSSEREAERPVAAPTRAPKQPERQVDESSLWDEEETS